MQATPESLVARLFPALDLAVFQSCGGRWSKVTELPDWWADATSLLDVCGDVFTIGDESPFLSEFVDDANRFWQSGSQGWLASGIWQESRADGSPLFLEARATCLDGVHLLLFKRLDATVDERISLIQKSRENKLAYGQDIAHRERLAVQLRRAKQAAEELSQAKSDFLAKMSHELRTPMNGVIGMTQLLLESNPTGEQRGYLEAVRDSAGALLSIINDILDFSKAEAAAMELNVSPFDIRELLDDTLKLLASLARGKGLELTATISDDVPHVLLGDPLRLRQIVFNLVGNSIKFTGAGHVALDVSLDSSSLQDTVLRFVVRDTGIGIAAEKREAIFDAFAQADDSSTDRRQGTGLGLSIARQLVHLMRGRLWLAETSPAGSQFCFTAMFPSGSVADPADEGRSQRVHSRIADPVEAAGIPVSKRSLRILLAEDNPLNQKVAIKILENRGHKLSVVDTGGKVVEAVQREHYDVILMDCHMPEMDGFEAAAAIRQREIQTGGRIPIIALTADASDAGREQCRAAGMDAYVSKPLDAEQVSQLMLELADRPNKTG